MGGMPGILPIFVSNFLGSASFSPFPCRRLRRRRRVACIKEPKPPGQVSQHAAAEELGETTFLRPRTKLARSARRLVALSPPTTNHSPRPCSSSVRAPSRSCKISKHGKAKAAHEITGLEKQTKIMLNTSSPGHSGAKPRPTAKNIQAEPTPGPGEGGRRAKRSATSACGFSKIKHSRETEPV